MICSKEFLWVHSNLLDGGILGYKSTISVVFYQSCIFWKIINISNSFNKVPRISDVRITILHNWFKVIVQKSGYFFSRHSTVRNIWWLWWWIHEFICKTFQLPCNKSLILRHLKILLIVSIKLDSICFLYWPSLYTFFSESFFASLKYSKQYYKQYKIHRSSARVLLAGHTSWEILQ